MRFAAFYALMLVVSGCGVQGAGDLPLSHVSVRGGELIRHDQWEARHSLALWTGEGKQFCSAVRIGSNQIATAGHCLANPMPDMMIGYGPGCVKAASAKPDCIQRPPIKDHQIQVLSTTVHPRYVSDEQREKGIGDDYHDVGLIVFSGELPIAVTPVANFGDFPTGSDELNQDHTLVKTGYGAMSDDDDSPPALRGVQLRVVRIDPGHGELEYVRHARRGTCPGDSGSPGFASPKSGLPKVVGLTSRGPDYDFRHVGAQEMSCNDGNGIDTDIRYYRDWFQCVSAGLASRLQREGMLIAGLDLGHESGDDSLSDCDLTAVELHEEFYLRIKSQCEHRPHHVYDEKSGACEKTRRADKKPKR